jgi:hypothetical protein
MAAGHAFGYSCTVSATVDKNEKRLAAAVDLKSYSEPATKCEVLVLTSNINIHSSPVPHFITV